MPFESRANSFSEEDEGALKRISEPVRIEVHLAPEDPRRVDLDRQAIAKLRRVLPRLEVNYISATAVGLFEQTSPHHGEIWYEVAGPHPQRGARVLRCVVRNRRDCGDTVFEEIGLMTGCRRRLEAIAIVMLVVAAVAGADVKVHLTSEQVGQPPDTSEPMVGTWVVAQDQGQKLIMADGRPWVASKDNPTKLLIEVGTSRLVAKTDSTSDFKNYEVSTR